MKSGRTERAEEKRRAREEREKREKEAESLRAVRFADACERFTREGYAVKDCTVGIKAANVFGILSALPFAAVGAAAYVLFAPAYRVLLGYAVWDFLVLAVLLVVSVPVHELLHGLLWAAANRSFAGIRFGFMREYLTPYCACETPMCAARYMAGSLAPFLVLGVGFTLAGVFSGSWMLTAAGLYNIFCAGADVFLSFKILFSGGGVFLDHPNRCGYYRFYK